MTGFIHMHLPFVSDYSRVLRARQDSLMSIQLLLTSTKVHNRNFLQVFSTHWQFLLSSILLMSHKLNTRVIFKISRGTKQYLCFFVNLDVSYTVHSYIMQYTVQLTSKLTLACSIHACVL